MQRLGTKVVCSKAVECSEVVECSSLCCTSDEKAYQPNDKIALQLLSVKNRDYLHSNLGWCTDGVLTGFPCTGIANTGSRDSWILKTRL